VLDYRDIPVLSSFAPLDIPGVRWAVLSEMDVQEAFAEADALGWKVARSGVLFVVVFGAVALLLATAIARPLVRLDAAVQRIAEGVPDVDIPVETDDEIGRLARTVGDMVARLSVREHERFGEILEASPDGIAVVDGEGTLVLVNAQTETLFGYAREDLLGQPVEILVPHWFTDTHPSKRAAFAKPTIRQMRTETGMICRRKDGSEFPAEIDLGPVEAPDGSLIVATVRDITVRRQAEEKLQLARVQAEAANRSKSAFLNNVSHESQNRRHFEESSQRRSTGQPDRDREQWQAACYPRRRRSRSQQNGVGRPETRHAPNGSRPDPR
jgi:PAS domain S-box-containing protein